MNYSPAWKAAMALCCVAALVAIVMQPAQADELTGKDKASFKDFAITSLAGCLTAKVSGLVIGPGFVLFKKEI